MCVCVCVCVCVWCVCVCEEREEGGCYESRVLREREERGVECVVCVYLRGRPFASFILSNKYSHGC